MITILKQNATKEQRDQLIGWLEEQGVEVDISEGEFQTILGLVGDTSSIDVDMIRMLDIVQDVKRVSEPYKKANRKFHRRREFRRDGRAVLGGVGRADHRHRPAGESSRRHAAARRRF